MSGRTIPLKAQAALSAFESARETVNAFRREHATLVEEYERICTEYNDRLEEVKATFRDNVDIIGTKFGEFTAVIPTLVDAEKLSELMGPAADPLLKLKYSVDREEYNKAVNAGLVPADIAAQVEYQGSVSIYGPKPIGSYGSSKGRKR